MGLTVLLYGCLAVLGGLIRYRRLQPQTEGGPEAQGGSIVTLRQIHLGLGILLVLAVLELLTIGIVGTLGHFGSLGHSPHLFAGFTVVSLVLTSAWSAMQINHPNKPWARSLHLTINGLLFVALAFVSWTGWIVVQKYL